MAVLTDIAAPAPSEVAARPASAASAHAADSFSSLAFAIDTQRERLGRRRRALDAARGHARAITKALTWRATGTLDTFFWSWLVTGHVGSAGAIASLETFTKTVLYYLHERMWRVLRWAPESHLRSLIKALSWRLVGGLDTFTLSLIVTGSAKYAVSIASIEAMTKIVLYYMHERAWRAIAWGRL